MTDRCRSGIPQDFESKSNEAVECAGDHRPIAVATAKALIALHAGRRSVGLPRLFADPAWDMLLDLFVAKAEQRAVSISSVSIASGVPASTAHRWIEALLNQAAVRRRPDPGDRRRIYIEITEPVFEAMSSQLLQHHARMQRIVR
ncbi:hypothetical protein HJG53_13790 [Sphingomonas sp. ID1715]|uniref:hypothetical protein n=1 Tax=Sphingomonas sp. ID1715 TaxID=1656898 RepID=UPI0014882213|nr:hypothetical protein [Sphingomonas sp. ID1715]NNM77975.1 hypothetical protein [Sphingomonas sp. ID1715]